jgi:hypothetical protein
VVLCAASLLSVTLAADAYNAWVLEGDGPGSSYWAHVIAWASPLLGWPAFTALIMVFLISPHRALGLTALALGRLGHAWPVSDCTPSAT